MTPTPKKATTDTAAVTPVVVTPTVTPTVVALPKWTDASSVQSYIASILGVIFAVITGLHPGYTEPTIVQTLLPIVGVLIAGAAQLVNVITHRGVQKVAIQAAVASAQVVGGQNLVIK